MVYYRRLLFVGVIALLLSAFFLQPGEARRTDHRRDSDVTRKSSFLPSIRIPSLLQGKVELDPARVDALRNLYEQMQSGAPVSDLEAAILQRFTDGDDISLVEADTVISRVFLTHAGTAIAAGTVQSGNRHANAKDRRVC